VQGDEPKTLIVFDNSQGITTAIVYDDHRRRDEDKIAEVPAGQRSAAIEWFPGESTFFFAYIVQLKGMDISLTYVAGVGQNQTTVPINADETTPVFIPRLEGTLSSPYALLSEDAYLFIQNNSFGTFRLHRGNSEVRPDGAASAIVNHGINARYTITPGLVSNYRLWVNAEYRPFPSSLVNFEAGRVYNFTFASGLTLISEVEIKLENIASTLPGSGELAMRGISAGAFQMGEVGIVNAEPMHSVTLTGFYMGIYPVTQEQYAAVMAGNANGLNASPSSFSSNPAAGEVQARRPVETVSWYDALVFCNRLSIQQGLTPVYRIAGSTDPAAWGTVPTSSDAAWNAVTVNWNANGYRLPTEAEWEYACRAGTTTVWYTGNMANAALQAAAWYDVNSGDRTHQVGLKAPNAWGLYDMMGNVWEWVWDWRGSYTAAAKTDPRGPDSGTFRVARGGSWWSDDAHYLRSAYRSIGNPSDRADGLGFRVVRNQ
jgi:formylglycine-generating enzyme required for sulfatase activity